eukprot:1156119-Pelagomonas_calceolata.AAC.7
MGRTDLSCVNLCFPTCVRCHTHKVHCMHSLGRIVLSWVVLLAGLGSGMADKVPLSHVARAPAELGPGLGRESLRLRLCCVGSGALLPPGKRQIMHVCAQARPAINIGIAFAFVAPQQSSAAAVDPLALPSMQYAVGAGDAPLRCAFASH